MESCNKKERSSIRGPVIDEKFDKIPDQQNSFGLLGKCLHLYNKYFLYITYHEAQLENVALCKRNNA